VALLQKFQHSRPFSLLLHQSPADMSMASIQLSEEPLAARPSTECSIALSSTKRIAQGQAYESPATWQAPVRSRREWPSYSIALRHARARAGQSLRVAADRRAALSLLLP